MEPSTAMTIILSVAGYKMLEKLIDMFFKRITRDDFITKADCGQCEKADADVTAKLTSEIATIKGILLVLAVKSGIPPEQLSKLTN